MAIKIFIDQGHNPRNINAGAEGFGLREQDITYNVGRYLADLLNKDPRFEARTSRNTPEEILGTNNSTSLARRVELANSWPANYFLSIHTNANTNGVRVRPSLYVLRKTTMPSALIELAYITNQSDAEKLRDDQYQFAYAIYEGLLSYFGFENINY